MTATSADGGSGDGWFVAVVGPAGDLGGVAEGVAEEVDGVALETESDVGAEPAGQREARQLPKLVSRLPVGSSEKVWERSTSPVVASTVMLLHGW
ncbi:hypothetical protein ACWECC_17365 [Streptomyces microflavus]|uniref:hypothetical protein n=1 Tax=Streptomyces microflavus TaxID=1919 RepID=UPI0033BC946A